MQVVVAGAAFAIAALVLLLGLTLWQNRDLADHLRGTGLPPGRVLARGLRLWSPVAVAIVLALVLAHALTALTARLVYRATPLDAWCEVANAQGRPRIPCSEQDRRVPVAALQRMPPRQAIERQVLQRYVEALDRLVAPAPDLRDAWRRYAPPAVIGLPEGPREDAELRRMREELRALVASPAPRAMSPLELLRVHGDTQIRTRRLRELTAALNARREALDRAAYAGLPARQQGVLWLRHELAHRLLQAQWPMEALQRVAATRTPAGADDAAILLRAKLAGDAAATLELLSGEDTTPKRSAALRLALPVAARCRWEGSDDDGFACPDLAGSRRLVLAPLPLAESLRLSIDRWRGQTRRGSLRVLGRSLRAARSGAVSAGEAADRLPRDLRRQFFPDRSDCGIARPADCAGQLLNASIERALAPASGWLDATLQRADDALEWRVGAIVSPLWRDIDVAHARAGELAGDWLRLHSRARLIGWLVLAFLALKSFLYVLGLEVFRHGGPQVLGLAGDAGAVGAVRVGRRLTLDPDFTGPLLTHRQLSNSDNHLRLAPWPGSAPLARLLHGRYLWYTRGSFLSADAAAGADLGRIASADAGQAIVEWRMRPGEEVVFGWRDFFGASENLRFHTRLSFRLSTLLLGRVLFRIAHCPADGADGLLLLRADVEQVESEHLHAVPPERLLAWSRQLRFRAHGAHTAWGVLVHGVTLVREPGAGIVLATSEDGGPRFGSLRFLRRLFSAIF